MRKNEKYSTIFVTSLLLFLFNYGIQGPVTFSYSDGYGLISKMGFFYWIGYLGMIFLLYYHFVNFERIDHRYVFLGLSLATIYLIGTPFFYETLPRFEDSWFHSFLAERMYETGKVLSTGNIYERYPGSFLFYGFLLNFIPSYSLMKFFPILFYFIGIIVVFLMFKDMDGPKTAFLITIFYMFFSWTVEDNHLSPQFLMLNLYLVFMFITINLLKNQKSKRGFGVIMIMMALTFAFSHFFTQVFIISTLGASFILVKRLRKGIFPILFLFVGVFLFHEVFFTTVLRTFVQGLIVPASDSPTASSPTVPSFSSLGSRLESEQLSRKIFIRSRLSILGLSMMLGVIGIINMYKQRFRIEAKFIFAWAFSLIPLLIIVFFTSTGEFAERFALVSALPLAVGTGFLFSNRRSGIWILVFLLALSPVYFVAKYGNEAFESKSLQRLRADCFSMFLELGCEEEMTLMHSPSDYYVEDLGKTHFTVTREEIMAASIYMNYGSTEEILKLIERIEDEEKLIRVYSTNEAWSYVSIQ